jgi:hypothetical protein
LANFRLGPDPVMQFARVFAIQFESWHQQAGAMADRLILNMFLPGNLDRKKRRPSWNYRIAVLHNTTGL